MKKVGHSKNNQFVARRQLANIICRLKDDIYFEEGSNQHLPSDEQINIIVENLGDIKMTVNGWEESVFEALKSVSQDNSLLADTNVKEFARSAITHLRRSTQYCHIWAH